MPAAEVTRPFTTQAFAPHQCEAEDWVPTEEDAVLVRCPRVGIRVVEKMPTGGLRTRVCCRYHRGLEGRHAVC